MLLAHSPYNKGALLRADDASSTLPFDVNNLGDYALVSSGQLGGRSGSYMIMKEKNATELTYFNLDYYTTAYLGYVNNFSISKFIINPAVAPNLASADIIIPSTDDVFGKFCFYVKDNNLYALDVSKMSQNTSVLLEQRLATFNSNYKVNKATFTLGAKRTNQIRLFLQDNSLSELKGGFLFYNLTTDGGLKATELKSKVGGFCDKLIDLTDKNN